MELSFATVALRSICEKRKSASIALGVVGARELVSRLADLIACETVAEVFELLRGDIFTLNPNECVVVLKSGQQLRFRSGHVNTPESETGTDWACVTRIKIVALETADD